MTWSRPVTGADTTATESICGNHINCDDEMMTGGHGSGLRGRRRRSSLHDSFKFSSTASPCKVGYCSDLSTNFSILHLHSTSILTNTIASQTSRPATWLFPKKFRAASIRKRVELATERGAGALTIAPFGVTHHGRQVAIAR